MKITLDIKKSVDENAAVYFERAKKARKKLMGVETTLETFKKKQEKAQREEIKITSGIKKLDDSKKHWYEKFRWFITSEGYLVIGGRDATSNEIIVKKHLSKNDLVFHTDMAGSPFVVIKRDEEIVPQQELTSLSIEEAASFTLIHSKLWKNGLSSGNVFWVRPEQVSKEANQGEFMAKGSFMIRGKTNYVDVEMKPGAGLVRVGEEQVFMVAPISVFSQSPIEIEQGKEKASVIAKAIRSRLLKEYDIDVHVDIIIRALPQGCQLKKVRKRKHEL